MKTWKKTLLIIAIIYLILIVIKSILGCFMDCPMSICESGDNCPTINCNCQFTQILINILLFGIPSWIIFLIILLKKERR
ncbi:MAG: hypothetical protein WC438_04645 [Candidatus Pacearchaeota archaeon]